MKATVDSGKLLDSTQLADKNMRSVLCCRNPAGGKTASQHFGRGKVCKDYLAEERSSGGHNGGSNS
jgi:hypothetical protein